MTKRTSAVKFLLLLSVVLLATTLLAQVQNGQIRGTITDPQGAAVTNAKVTVTNPATQESKSTLTNTTGLFTVDQVSPGNYKVSVEASGFKTTTTPSVTVNAGTITRLDFKMTIGERTETIEVSGVTATVETEDAKLAQVVDNKQIQNLPLNGRNVYDLMQLAPGAVNVVGVLSENGNGTVVNGLREDFNGFLINGVSNKGLSGGAVNLPIEDTVQEFQQLTLNMSAAYGSSAGSNVNLVTKPGTNNFHGSLWWFLRNDNLDANNFFIKHDGTDVQLKALTGEDKPELRFNQFGLTFGGPIMKNKLFFFASYQGDRFITSGNPQTIDAESPAWRAAVEAAAIPGQPGDVSALLYSNFAPLVPGVPHLSLNDYTGGDMTSWLCPDNYAGMLLPGGTIDTTGIVHAQSMANIVGVTAADTGTGCTTPLPAGPAVGTFGSRDNTFMNTTVSLFKTQTSGNQFQGNEGSLRLDYNLNDSNLLFGEFKWFKSTDAFGPQSTNSGGRGFTNPSTGVFPIFTFNYVHTFSPTIVNEFHAGYTGNILLIRSTFPGVPNVYFDSGEMGFGSYNGYPQFFKENIYTYGDMVSISHGKHNFKIGYDLKRNIENSEFDIARPSYYFSDPLFFSVDAPYGEAAGVQPCLTAAFGCSTPHLQTNDRHWRNWEHGAYFQDDWKVMPRLTLNLGIRYELFQRHTEQNNLVTTFLPGPGTHIIDNITTGQGWMQQANTLAGLPGCNATLAQERTAQLAGVCGPGGFAPANSLGAGDHNDWGPKIGFAWDVFGNGKTSLRGGYGVSYEGTLYNPLSNSRWNLPFYSFNTAFNGLGGSTQTIVYGPQNPGCLPVSFTGGPCAANNEGAPGTPSGVGNIQGWFATNPNFAKLTGIILPQGIRDPYVHNWFLSIQHELMPRTVLEVDYVGDAGHKLFRAQDINRIPGGRLCATGFVGGICQDVTPLCATDTFGRTECSQFNNTPDPFTGNPVNSTGRLNGNYGTMRNWQNSVSSNYNALQAALRMSAYHGLSLNVAYTWSHAIDDGSTWHSGATSANGAAACEGYSLDQTLPGLCRGNSIFDIRQRLVVNYVWELPFFKGQGGWKENVLGGWQLNGIWSYQSGAHWTPWCSRRSDQSRPCDFNKDGVANDRPNVAAGNVDAGWSFWADGWNNAPGSTGNFILTDPGAGGFFTRPCATANVACVGYGNEGRNSFVGPSFFGADMSLFKNFKVTERVRMQFRAEAFNAFNHANFQLPANPNNRVNLPSTFGRSAGTFNPRQLQFGIKASF